MQDLDIEIKCPGWYDKPQTRHNARAPATSHMIGKIKFSLNSLPFSPNLYYNILE